MKTIRRRTKRDGPMWAVHKWPGSWSIRWSPNYEAKTKSFLTSDMKKAIAIWSGWLP